jgi:hypothetical protein
MTASERIASVPPTPGESMVRRWANPRSLRTGLGSGLLGGLCCIGAAVTTAAGLGAAGFFSGLMEDYQLYFILGSAAVMIAWLIRHLRRQGISPLALRAAAPGGGPPRPGHGRGVPGHAGHRDGCGPAAGDVTRWD